jgi:uncharacterized membrane protein YjdF
VSTDARLAAKLIEAERKAWDSLARYKFLMFGYWAAQWVLCRGLTGDKIANPFRELVTVARSKLEEATK